MPSRAMIQTIALLLAFSACPVPARHAHARIQHQHLPRQADEFSIQTVPNPAPTSDAELSALTANLQSCLASMPQELSAIIQAVENRLGAVQSQISGLSSLLSGLPTAAPLASSSAAASAFAVPPHTSALPIVTAFAPPALISPQPTSSLLVALSSAVSNAASFSPSAIYISDDPGLCSPADGLGPKVPCADITSTTPVVLSTPSFLPSPIYISNDPGLCPPPDGLGPNVPCSGTTTRTTHVTLTETTSRMVTFQIPIPVNVTPGSVYPQVTLTGGISSTVQSKIPFPSTGVPLPSPPPPPVFHTPANFTAMTLTTITDYASSSKPVSSPTSSAYVFDANARDNLAVYYGSTPATSSGGLAAVCNANVDIVILAFLYDFFSANGYPTVDFGSSSCSGMTTAQAANAPGLRNCSALATQIQTCQDAGKKVLLSLGGYLANSSFTSALEARTFAITLWDLFGAGVGEDDDLRPFGPDVVIDGFDIDNEDHTTAYWDVFASAMRALFNSDDSKDYYLSAAPQCPQPDASIPMYTLQHADFVWVQFYNNPSCNLDSPGFQSSFASWSRNLTNSSLSTSPRLYIGAPAFPAAGSGWVNATGLSSRVSLARELFVDNQGGIMLWDGSEGLDDVDVFGNTYLDYAKWAMQY